MDIILVQLIGPENSGKTALREALCPYAVNIDHSLHSMFNGEMDRAQGYWCEEVKDTRKLAAWVDSFIITIIRQGQRSIEYVHRGIWIYEGIEPLNIDCETRIWHIEKILGH